MGQHEISETLSGCSHQAGYGHRDHRRDWPPFAQPGPASIHALTQSFGNTPRPKPDRQLTICDGAACRKPFTDRSPEIWAPSWGNDSLPCGCESRRYHPPILPMNDNESYPSGARSLQILIGVSRHRIVFRLAWANRTHVWLSCFCGRISRPTTGRLRNIQMKPRPRFC